MKKTVYSLLCCYIFSLASAAEKIVISSGGTSHSSGHVRSIGIAPGVSGRGQTPLVGVGLPYLGKAKVVDGMRQLIPAPVKVVVSEINSEFRLGDVYVYPNPAKGGQIPTFHIETGIPDTIKVTIYSVSGEVAHNYTITGQPIAVDDGNGLEYAYEYAWRGHIPSGVYYFIVEAQKAGKRLKRAGKFAVVR